MPPELGRTDQNRVNLNTLYKKLFGGNVMTEPTMMIEETVDYLELRGWPTDVPLVQREACLKSMVELLPRPGDGSDIKPTDRLLIRLFGLQGHPVPTEQSAA